MDDLDKIGLSQKEKDFIKKLCEFDKGKDAIFIGSGGELFYKSYENLFNEFLQDKLNKGELTLNQFMKLKVKSNG